MKKHLHIVLLVIFALIIGLSSCEDSKSPVETTPKDTLTNQKDTLNYVGVSTYTGTIKELYTPYGNYFSMSSDGKFFIPTLNDKMKVFDPQDDPDAAKVYYTKDYKVFKHFDLMNSNDYFKCNVACFTKDGKSVAMSGTCYNGWFGSGSVFWEIGANTYIDISPKSRATQMEFLSQENDTLLLNFDGYFYRYIYYYDTLEQIKGFPNTNTLHFGLSSDNKYMLLNKSGIIAELNNTNAEIIYQSPGYGSFFPDNKKAIMCLNNKIKLIDLETGKIIKTVTDTNNYSYGYSAVSKNGKFFATSYVRKEPGNNNGYHEGIQIWETTTNGIVCKYDMINSYSANPEINKIEFGEDETQLVVSRSSGISIFQINYQLKK